jgi:hypothetical protein
MILTGIMKPSNVLGQLILGLFSGLGVHRDAVRLPYLKTETSKNDNVRTSGRWARGGKDG